MNTEVFVDHESNLSSTDKSVFHLELSLLQTGFLLEMGVRDDQLQDGRNVRIKHLKIRESTPSNWLWRLTESTIFTSLIQHNFRGEVRTQTYLGLELVFSNIDMSKD